MDILRMRGRRSRCLHNKEDSCFKTVLLAAVWNMITPHLKLGERFGNMNFGYLWYTQKGLEQIPYPGKEGLAEAIKKH